MEILKEQKELYLLTAKKKMSAAGDLWIDFKVFWELNVYRIVKTQDKTIET